MSDLKVLVDAAMVGLKKGEKLPTMILRDYLQEHELPEAGSIQETVARYEHTVQYAKTHDFSRAKKYCKGYWMQRADRDLKRGVASIVKAIRTRMRKRPTPEPANPFAEKLAKAEAYLAHWERKMKFAKNKAAKYRKRVSYYTRKLA